MEFSEMLERIRPLTGPRRVNEYVEVAYVAAALLTDRGSLYTGVNMDVACGIGFCAEHAAVADMVKHGEHNVVKMVAVDCKGRILPPCGRCRELISQIGNNNADCEVLIGEGRVLRLAELLPHDWRGEDFSPKNRKEMKKTD